MNQKQAALLFGLVGVLAAGLAFLTAPMLASLLGAVESYSDSDGPAAKAEPMPSAAAETLGSVLPRPAPGDGAAKGIGTVDSEVSFSPVVLQEILDELSPEVRACSGDWDDRAGPLPAQGGLRLTLTPGGLEGANLEGVDAPEGFRACLGAVIWQTRWPAPAAATTLRYPLVLGASTGETDAVDVSSESQEGSAPADASVGGAP